MAALVILKTGEVLTMPRFNSMIDVAFSVNHDFDVPEDLFTNGMELVLDALEQRLRYLRENPMEAAEAFGVCDTYENEDSHAD